MRKVLFNLALLLSITCNVALAQRAAPVDGPAALSCGSYTEARINDGTIGPNSIQVFAWIQGYLSGYNNFAKYPIVTVPELPAIAKFMDKYCAENPMHHVANGVNALLAELGGYKQPYLGK